MHAKYIGMLKNLYRELQVRVTVGTGKAFKKFLYHNSMKQ